MKHHLDIQFSCNWIGIKNFGNIKKHNISIKFAEPIALS